MLSFGGYTVLKLAGAILLLSGSTGAGLSAIRRLEHRVVALRALSDALQVMEHELEFQMPTMKELFVETAQRSNQPASRFLNACAREMGEMQERPLFDLWKERAADELPELSPCDLDVLLTLGGILGRYDAEGQRCAIAAARARLSNHLTDAAEERRRKGRVYGALSITLGMFAVILLI